MVVMGGLAGVISLFAYIPYILSILHGKTVPSKSTWWILSALGGVTFLSYRDAGGFNTSFFLLGDVIGSSVVAFLSLFYGKKSIQKLDIFCFLGAAASFILWFFINENPSIAFCSGLFVEVIAMIPTIRKIVANPFEEDIGGWFLTFLASVVNSYAIEEWSFVVFFYPFYEVGINGLVVFLISSGRKKLLRVNIPFIRMDSSALAK